MTEDEARKRWCPFVRDMQSGGGNRMAYGGDCTEAAPGDLEQFASEMADMHPCIASQCMAWRWGGSDYVKEPGKPVVEVPRGYCGLAGEPA